MDYSDLTAEFMQLTKLVTAQEKLRKIPENGNEVSSAGPTRVCTVTRMDIHDVRLG